MLNIMCLLLTECSFSMIIGNVPFRRGVDKLILPSMFPKLKGFLLLLSTMEESIITFCYLIGPSSCCNLDLMNQKMLTFWPVAMNKKGSILLQNYVKHHTSQTTVKSYALFTFVLIFIFIITFWLLCSLAFFKEFQIEPFIWTQ